MKQQYLFLLLFASCIAFSAKSQVTPARPAADKEPVFILNNTSTVTCGQMIFEDKGITLKGDVSLSLDAFKIKDAASVFYDTKAEKLTGYQPRELFLNDQTLVKADVFIYDVVKKTLTWH